jgi:hypothetical protein
MAALLPNVIFDVVRPPTGTDEHDVGSLPLHLSGVTGTIERSWLEGSQYAIRLDPPRDVTMGDLVQNLRDFQGQPWPSGAPDGTDQLWQVVKRIASAPMFAPFLEIYIRR